MLSFVLQEVSNNTQQNTTRSEDWTIVYFAVRWIQLSMAVLSILGSASIIVYATFQRLVRTPEFQPLLFLSVTDFLLALSWLIGAVLFTQDGDNHGNCYNLHIVEQMLYMASFFYTLNYVWTLYSGLKNKFYRSLNGCPAHYTTKVSSFSKLAAVLSCVFPVLLMVPVFVTGNMGYCYRNFSKPYKCLLMHTEALFVSADFLELKVDSACQRLHMYSIAAFLTAFVLTFIGIVVLMGKARAMYRRCVTTSGFLSDRQWTSLRGLERRMLLYPSVFLFCWGPAVLLAAMILYNPRTVEGVVGVILYVLQAFTSSSQGLLNCVVYGWTQRHFRLASKDALRDMDTQTPLLRSQKKGYKTLWSTPSPNTDGSG
ncbi:transmembrane protein 116 [Esox lucius]|uniref:G-protein coupled receptors family 1 profile domain-containing protein n=1 Tax=Esox lucius TaxID=8010 RepID=A0A3P8ZH05_ESOLU|nr:transmembrane protein 116 [Esox lucius]